MKLYFFIKKYSEGFQRDKQKTEIKKAIKLTTEKVNKSTKNKKQINV